jgi:hypothetical protein
MSKKKKSEKFAEGGLFLNISLFLYGLLCTAGGLFTAKEAYDSLYESNSIWLFAGIAVMSLVIFIWGLVLIAASLFRGNRRLQTVVEKLDGSNEFGCLSVVLAIPVYLLAKLLRRLSSGDSHS